jgi:hypothetical protein
MMRFAQNAVKHRARGEALAGSDVGPVQPMYDHSVAALAGTLAGTVNVTTTEKRGQLSLALAWS